MAATSEAVAEEEEETNKLSDAIADAFVTVVAEEAVEEEEEEEDQDVDEQVALKFYFGALRDLMVVKVIQNEDDESNRDLTFEWAITDVQRGHIDMQLTFEVPINVTPQDTLEVTLIFEEFESGLPNQQVQIFMTKQ